jgi:hypothetical protein
VQTYQSISRFHENHIPPVRLPLPSVIASAPAHLFFGTALGGHQILERPGRCRGQKKAWIQEVEQGRREILPRFLIRAGAGRPLPARASVMGCIFTWASTNGRNGGPNDGVEPLGTACGFASVSLCASPTGTRLGFVWSDWQLSLARTDKSAANEPRD